MSERCCSCNSFRLAKVVAKCSDMCVVQMAPPDDSYDIVEHVGDVPEDMNIGNGDYVEFEFCLECGQMQGEFPTPMTAFEIRTGLSPEHS